MSGHLISEQRSNIPNITSSFLHGAIEMYLCNMRATHFKRFQWLRHCRSLMFNPLSDIRTKQTIHEQRASLMEQELKIMRGRWRSRPNFTRIRVSHSYFLCDNNDPVICVVHCLTHICCIDCVVC